ncbi:MAG: hypothetical protein IJU65_07820 [Desulfovibrio sp.]|nr:hypothetical protein [Desulfovibrio sp.]
MEIDKAKLTKFVSTKFDKTHCPICGGEQWIISDKIFQLTEFNNGNLVVGGPLYLVLPVICAQCGNTCFINPVLLDNMDFKSNN